MSSPNPTPLVIQTVSTPEPDQAVDSLVTTQHTVETTQGTLCYTATTGRIVLHEEELKDGVFTGLPARAQMGVTAYTLNDADAGQRPITFCFNGGPGSASLWLHLGLVGPRIVDVGDAGSPAPPPYRLSDNAHTLLRDTDLVVIDAMSTGYSRAVEGNKPTLWHGWKADVDQFTELIRLWLTREDRWMSPKFLLGESYGTVRAVSVAQKLQDDYGCYVNGIILLSSVLDFGSQDFDNHRWDDACINFLPTYAALAWYHGKHPGKTLDQVRQRAEAFADERYRLALAKGRRLPDSEKQAVTAELAELTGLSESYITLANLRVEHMHFCQELLRDKGLVIGRIDGRFTGPARSGTKELMEADPSGDLTLGSFTAALHHYLRSELGCTEQMNYQIAANLWENWNYHEFEGRPVNVTDKLERVMRANPACRVRIEYGYFDLATPYFAAEDMVDHLQLPEEAFERIEHSWFETGHMPYLNQKAREREADEQGGFIRSVS